MQFCSENSTFLVRTLYIVIPSIARSKIDFLMRLFLLEAFAACVNASYMDQTTLKRVAGPQYRLHSLLDTGDATRRGDDNATITFQRRRLQHGVIRSRFKRVWKREPIYQIFKKKLSTTQNETLKYYQGFQDESKEPVRVVKTNWR